MKELLAILEAMEKARHTVARYLQSGGRNAEEAMQELIGILDNDELNCAFEKLQVNIAGPPFAPDAAPLKKAPVEG
jgi:hypothetical protein